MVPGDRPGYAWREQEKECRQRADGLGWEVVGVCVDNDVSAYSGKRRPQYEQMVEAVNAGLVQAVLAWHPDRITRQPKELEARSTFSTLTA